MFFSILKWVIISLTLIFLVHHLYMFLMNTLTVPKIKDLVNKPTQQYQAMLGGKPPTPPLYGKMENGNNTDDDPVTGAREAPLTDELSSFLSDLKKKNVGPSVAGSSVAGPSVAGSSVAGPGSLGPGSLGPSADKFPSTLGSLGGEMGYSLY
jgi:hypothetical protein